MMRACRWSAAVVLVTAGFLLVLAGQAYASLGEFSLTGSFAGFIDSENVAVDEASGDVYVYDVGRIKKFDAEGKPVDFSALGSNEITGVSAGGGDETELAVDNSSGPAKGDIYLAGVEVRIFSSAGAPLGKLTPAAGIPWGETACGVAVDGSGNVYVGVYPSNINKYVPTANPVTNSDYSTTLGGLDEVCNVGAGPLGEVYSVSWSNSRYAPIFRFDPQFEGASQLIANAGGSIAVANSPNAEAFTFVNRATERGERGYDTEMLQYDSRGNLLSSFGTPGSDYSSVAVNAKNGRLYVSNGTQGVNPDVVEIWQGAFIPLVQTDVASGLEAIGAATLNGTINPEGASVGACSFEYGASTSYGESQPCAQTTPLTGNSDVAVSAGVSGLVPNHVYHYRLTATDSHARFGGDQTVMVPIRPTVEDAPPVVSLITRAGARLTGTINPEYVEADYSFEYGTSESYGDRTPKAHVDIGSTDTEAVAQLGELLPDTTYHYRLVATNVAGRSVGADHTFTTGPFLPPTVATGAAVAVAQNTATLTGTIDTNGLPTSYGFEIGTSTDYGPRTGLGAAGAGLSKAPVSLPLTGLLPGTTYHYRITATNVDGTVYGADETFTTSTFVSTFAEPPAPLPFVTVPQIAFPKETGAAAHKPAKKTKPKPKRKPRKRAKHKKAAHKRKS